MLISRHSVCVCVCVCVCVICVVSVEAQDTPEGGASQRVG
jgi:hypothetical protein